MRGLQVGGQRRGTFCGGRLSFLGPFVGARQRLEVGAARGSPLFDGAQMPGESG